MKRFRSHVLLLGLIFLGALLLRLVGLDILPLGFHRDEIMNGYVGRFILENGVDLYGNRWPLLYFDNFGDFPNVIPMYISGFGTLLFGSTIFGVRFPIALFGALTIFPVYGLIVYIFQKRWLGLLGAFLLAITPWHIIFSRATAEGVTAGFVFITAIWLLVTGIKPMMRWKIGLSVLLFASTYFLYPSYRILVPLTWLAVPFLVSKRKDAIMLSVITVLFFGMTLGISQTEWGRGRFEQTSIFSKNHEVDAQTMQFILGSKGPIWLTRAFHNKAVVGGREFVNQYLTYFSGGYLFSRGGHPTRYALPDQGLLFYAVLVALMLLFVPDDVLKRIGIEKPTHEAFKKGKKHIFVFLFYLLLITPIPSALTRDDVPNMHRSMLISILYIFPTLYAFSHISSWKIRKLPKFKVSYLLYVLIAIEFVYFARIYVLHANSYQALRRHDETNALVRDIIDSEDQYDRVLVPTDQQMALHYLLIQNNYDPQLAGQFGSSIIIDKIGNIEFYPTDCPSTHIGDAPGTAISYDKEHCEKPKTMNVTTTFKSALGVDVYKALVKD